MDITKESPQVIAVQRLLTESYAHLNRTRAKSVEDGECDGRINCTYAGSGCAFTPAIKPDALADMIANDTASEFDALHLLTDELDLLHDWIHAAADDITTLDIIMSIQAAHDACRSTEGDEFLEEFDANICQSLGLGPDNIVQLFEIPELELTAD